MNKLWKIFVNWYQGSELRFLAWWLHQATKEVIRSICEWVIEGCSQLWGLVPEPARGLVKILVFIAVGGTFFITEVRGKPLDHAVFYSAMVAFIFLAFHYTTLTNKQRRSNKLRRFYKVIAFFLALLMIASAANKYFVRSPRIIANRTIVTFHDPLPLPEDKPNWLNVPFPRCDEYKSFTEINAIGGKPKIDSSPNNQFEQRTIVKVKKDLKKNSIYSSPSIMVSHIDLVNGQTRYYPRNITNLYKPIFLNINCPQNYRLFKEVLAQKYDLMPLPEILSYIHYSRTCQTSFSLGHVINFYKHNSILTSGSYLIRNYISKYFRTEENLIKNYLLLPNLKIVSMDIPDLLNIPNSKPEISNIKNKKCMKLAKMESTIAIYFHILFFAFFLLQMR